MDTENLTSQPAEGQAETLHPELADAIDRAEKRIAKLRTMGPALLVAAELEKRFPDNYMSRRVDGDRGEVDITFTFKTIAEAAEVLRVFTHEKGLRQTRSSYTNPEYKTMSWAFPGFYVQGYFSSAEADACKFVQVGTKTVPVYELRCGDKPAEAPQEPAAPAKQPYPEGMSEADVRSAEAELEGAPF